MGLPPINGLYTTLFAMLFYTIFGTSKHFSAGTEAIACLLTASAINNYENVYFSDDIQTNLSLNETGYLSNDPAEAKAIIAMAITILVGIIQILLGILHLGVIAKYIPDSMVDGFKMVIKLNYKKFLNFLNFL